MGTGILFNKPLNELRLDLFNSLEASGLVLVTAIKIPCLFENLIIIAVIWSETFLNDSECKRKYFNLITVIMFTI